MTATAKVELIRNADLVKFVVKRKQVKERPARNQLGSPVKNRVQSSETVEVPIVTSLDDSNITEIGVILTDQSSSDTSLVRHFTGFDLGLKGNTDGDFQYSVEIEALSAFTTILNQILKNLDLALSSYNEYVSQSRSWATIPISKHLLPKSCVLSCLPVINARNLCQVYILVITQQC